MILQLSDEDMNASPVVDDDAANLGGSIVDENAEISIDMLRDQQNVSGWGTINNDASVYKPEVELWSQEAEEKTATVEEKKEKEDKQKAVEQFGAIASSLTLQGVSSSWAVKSRTAIESTISKTLKLKKGEQVELLSIAAKNQQRRRKLFQVEFFEEKENGRKLSAHASGGAIKLN